MTEYVCERCMAGSSFVPFVAKNGKAGVCSFCIVRQEPALVLSLETLLRHIEDEVKGTFTKDVGEYCNDDGEPVIEALDSFELMEAIGLCIANERLSERIRSRFSGNWLKHGPMAPTEYEVNSGAWSRFKDLVKHSHRYTFWHFFDADRSEHDEEHVHPANVPPMLLQTVRKLILLLPEGTILWRVQVLNAHEIPEIPKRFTSPPVKKALQPNRMSPAGVSMFYGADDFETAVLETTDTSDTMDMQIVGLQFEALISLHILDLTKAYGNLHHKYHERYKGKPFCEDEFLPAFARDLSKPIVRDGKEDIEYVPTQVFTECVRHMMKAEDGSPIHGIKYTSSKTGKPCFVISHIQFLSATIFLPTWTALGRCISHPAAGDTSAQSRSHEITDLKLRTYGVALRP